MVHNTRIPFIETQELECIICKCLGAAAEAGYCGIRGGEGCSIIIDVQPYIFNYPYTIFLLHLNLHKSLSQVKIRMSVLLRHFNEQLVEFALSKTSK